MIPAALLLTTTPIKVTITGSPGRWWLRRGGKPYVVRGAGASRSDDASLAKLKAYGGNSIRTWGVGDDTQALLDTAHRHGLTVTLGFWLGHTSHGFRWTDRAMLDRQFAEVRAGVREYKNHPAVLAYTLGNEMEMGEPGDHLWIEIERLARLVRQEDPSHPVGTVIAEIGGDKIGQITRLAPSLQFVGVNSYGGADTLPDRLARAGWTKPYMITEMGPSGPWEVARTPWGAPLEPTSTQKAEDYARRWRRAVLEPKGRSLGGYAFLWGDKMEETATWFGMFLPSGEPTESVARIAALWGKPVRREIPKITRLRFAEGSGEFRPGDPVRVDLGKLASARATERWTLLYDGAPTTDNPNDPQRTWSDVPGTWSSNFRAPAKPGRYRIFVFLTDPSGFAATGNLPLLVKTP